MKLKTKTTAFVLLCILAPASIFVIYPMSLSYLMSLSPEVYGPKTSNMLIHIFSSAAAEFAAFESATGADAIDIVDWPLPKGIIDLWSVPPYNTYIRLHDYSALDDFDFDLNNQRWPTGVTEPRAYDSVTDSYKHYYGTSEWDDEAREFRKALAYLTDKDGYITRILKGYGYRKDTPVPIPVLQGYTDYEDLEAKGLIYHYNPEIAAAILDAAGFVQGSTPNPYYDPTTPGSAQYLRTDPRYGGDLQPLVFYVRMDDTMRRDAGRELTYQLLEAGIPVTLIETDKTVCHNNVEGLYDYHIYTGGWSLCPDIDYLYDLFHSSMYWGGSATSYFDGLGWSPNYAGFCDDEFDTWAELAKYGLTFDEVKTGALGAQEIHARRVATIPVWTRACVKAYKTGWEDTVGMAGEGKDNYWSFLNMYNTVDTPQNPGDDEIDWGFSSTVEGGNVITAEWQWDRKFLRLIYDSLLGYNPYNFEDVFGWLAEHWETGLWEPGRMYVLFRLRPGVTFHNGDPLTPTDVKFSLEFTKACGFGVSWTYPVKNGGTFWTHSNLQGLDHVDTQVEDPTLGSYEVKVYFDCESYWALHWAGFVPILNHNIWMAANNLYGWGYVYGMTDPNLFTNRMMVRDYPPQQSDVDGDAIVDLEEDGTGAWIFTGYAPSGPISAATSIAFNANTNFYLSQDYIANYLIYAFHNVGDVDDDGLVNGVDLLIVQKALGTDKWNYPWGTDWGEYNPDADINTCSWDMVTGTPSYGDGYIDILDLAIVDIHFGLSADGPPLTYPPTADFTPLTCETFYVCESVLFDASASLPGFDGDESCPIVEYQWDFGDATSLVTTEPLTTHHYTTPGDYDVDLTVYAPGIPPFIDPGYDPYDSEVHTIHIVSKLEPRKLIDIVEFPGTVILEDIPVDETLLAKFAAMEGFNEAKDLLTAKGYNFAETAANASRVTGGLDENTFSGVVLSWWSDIGPNGTRALIAAALMDDGTTMVFGVITNLLPPELTPEGKYIIVDAMPYVYVEWYWWAWSPLGKIVRWSYWWYDSHSHPNWYWGCYWWWRIYVRNYIPSTGLPHWLPWWWWYWHWTYWRHWYWWSTSFPYDP